MKAPYKRLNLPRHVQTQFLSPRYPCRNFFNLDIGKPPTTPRLRRAYWQATRRKEHAVIQAQRCPRVGCRTCDKVFITNCVSRPARRMLFHLTPTVLSSQIHTRSLARMVPPIEPAKETSSRHACRCGTGCAYTLREHPSLDLQQGAFLSCHCRYAGFIRAVDLLAQSLHAHKATSLLRHR